MMNFWGTVIVLLLTFGQGIAQNPDKLQALWQQEGLKHAAIGVSVKNVTDGKVVYEHNPGMALRPASVLKLLPTSLALKLKGDSLTYQTKVFYTGEIKEGLLQGNIVIEVGGDPCLDSKYFKDAVFTKRLVDSIVGLGIRRIEGAVIIQVSRVRGLGRILPITTGLCITRSIIGITRTRSLWHPGNREHVPVSYLSSRQCRE